jgi:hypothetical protein
MPVLSMPVQVGIQNDKMKTPGKQKKEPAARGSGPSEDCAGQPTPVPKVCAITVPAEIDMQQTNRDDACHQLF